MINFTYFGSSRLSVIVLDELFKFDLKPSLIVTTPDKPQGRKLEVKPNVVKEWAISHQVPVLSPDKLDGAFIENLKLKLENFNLFIVASYGKIIPNEIINLPKHKTLNIHPSLLPKYRGASPLPTAMLDDTKVTGVSIMQLDAEMDHGPIVAQKQVLILNWPTYEEYEKMMAILGAHLLAETLPKWLEGKIVPTEQNHSKATYTKKITKEDGLINLTVEELKDNSSIPSKLAYDIFRKIQAFHEWPQVYFFIERDDKKIRVKITQASYKKIDDSEEGLLYIEKVIPEGKKEMSYDDFVRGYLK